MDCNDQEQVGVRGTGLYIDVENLQADGQALIHSLTENWPDELPSPSRMILFVRADQVALWKLWATSRYPDMEVVVKGTQHFSRTPSKNSADIAIASCAMADFVRQRVSSVVVFSDDSDFISLCVAIQEESNAALPNGNAPFLWAVTDREGTLSATVKQFFPPDILHIVSLGSIQNTNFAPSKSPKPQSSQKTSSSSGNIWTEMAMEVLKEIPVGVFKSTDCQPVIKSNWPEHNLSKTSGSDFGIQFKGNIWPILEKYGVSIPNPSKKPIAYEMTDMAKQAFRELE